MRTNSQNKTIAELSAKAALYILGVDNIRKIYRGDIYLVEIENARGSEQNGVRPAVIIQNDVGNAHAPTTIVAFITSRHKKPLPTHVSLHCRGLEKKSTAMLEQIRTISKNRLKSYICTVGKYDMRNIDQALRISMGCINKKAGLWN